MSKTFFLIELTQLFVYQKGVRFTLTSEPFIYNVCVRLTLHEMRDIIDK